MKKISLVNKRYNFLIVILFIAMFVLVYNLYNVQIVNTYIYKKKLHDLTHKYTYGSTAPRGRIYDRNGELIVDNKATRVIYYKKDSNITSKEEISNAYKLADLIDLDCSKLTDKMIKNFWIAKNPKEANLKITNEEWQQLNDRLIDNKKIENLKLDRINVSELGFGDRDKKASYIYYLMNKGYLYDDKVIKKDNISEEEYVSVSNQISNLKGFTIKLDWKREYLYGDTFKSVLGSVGQIPEEKKEYYLSEGYDLDDLVGISYLEQEYDNYLRGVKNKYEIVNGESRLIQEGKKGNDIYLTIDIKLQKEVESILEKEIKNAKNEPNTEYYDKSFVVISDPKNGEIYAMAGKQLKNDKFIDYTTGIVNYAVTPGSIVKGASHIVGYNNGALTIGEYRDDSCIKIISTPEKCSVYYMGYIDDLTALALSSNTYQFRTAIKVGKGLYGYNQPLIIDLNAFDIYRNTFKEFGLGTITGIDLPGETEGYKGNSKVAGHLLDFSIGQYDTYTPIQLLQYISTIANNGTRVKPQLLKKVVNKDELVYESKRIELNKVNTDEKYLKRVQDGLRAVVAWGTGYYFVDQVLNAAGKTGTSQSFIDTDGDKKIDTETITTTFAAYAPFDNPKVSFVVISPDVSHYDNDSVYQSNVNGRISYEISNKFFEYYK